LELYERKYEIRGRRYGKGATSQYNRDPGRIRENSGSRKEHPDYTLVSPLSGIIEKVC
jgi:hypothetical protein